MSYNQFAWYYDSLMEPQFYEDYFLYLNQQLPDFHSCLDLGCGTGTFTRKLDRFDRYIVGVDLSEEMLEIAREKNAHVQYIQSDMQKFQSERYFDVVLCLCDSLNYVLGFENQVQVLKNCFNHLQPNGILIFDIHSQEKINHTFLNYSEEEESVDYYYYWSVKKTAPYEITHTVVIEDLEEDVRMEEKHIQQSFPKAWYLDALAQLGFCEIKCEDVFNDKQRLVFYAKKKEDKI